MNTDISVVIHTKNAAKTLQRAIQSVRPLAREILVIDMESTDDTVAVARQAGAVVHKVKDAGYADPARNAALEQAKGPWVLVLDADEEIPPSLLSKLRELSQDLSIHGYELPRKNMIFGTWAKTGWWPDYILRFAQKGHVHWQPGVHGSPVGKGEIRRLEAREEYAIVHHNYETVEEFVERMNRYTSLAAQESDKKSDAFIHAMYEEFNRRFFADKGYEQGTYGLALSLLQSCYECVLAIKQWEKAGMPENGQAQNIDEKLNTLFQHVCYWIADTHVQTEQNPVKKIYWMIRRKLRV